MKCSHCGREGVVAEMMIKNGNNIEKIYLCHECQKKYGPNLEISGINNMINKLFGGSALGLLSNLNSFVDVPTRVVVCPDCKTTSDEFLKTGFVGCPRCYRVFEPLIAQTVKKIQQADRHIGKTPLGAVDNNTEISRLRSEIIAAMNGGDFTRMKELSAQLEKLQQGNREG